MTVPTTSNKVIAAGNGVSTVFPFTFGTLPTGDLVVTLFDLLGNEYVQTENSDYTVQDEGEEDGGSVTFLSAPTSGWTVLIQRIIPETQPTDLKNQGSFYPRTIERMFDRVTMLIQQLSERISSALTLPPQVTGVSTRLPVPEGNKLIGWNSVPDGLRNFSVSELATTLAFSNFIADTFTATPGQVDFILSDDPGSLGNLDVSIDGVTQAPGADYNYDNTTLTFVTPMVGGEKVLVRYGTALPTGITAAGAIIYSQSGTGAVDRAVDERLRDTVSVSDFTSTQTAITEAGIRRGEVFVPAGQFDISTVSNPAGARFYGPGQIVQKPDGNSTNWRLLNSYADSLTYDLGKEYLYAFHASVYAFTRPKIYLYGDSTVEGIGTAAPFRPQDVLDATFFAQGLATFEITNLGVSGQASNGWDPSAAIADANCRLLIVSYGINDGSWGDPGDDFELFYTNMAARLTTIRASRGVDSMAICIKASNSTNDWFNGRHQVWHERLNGVYKRLAREFKCYFFDTYALWNDSQGASTWMDSISYGGQIAHIHPVNLANQWIWGKLAEELVPRALNQRLYNCMRNVRADHAALLASALPSAMPFGISMHRATVAGGWPLDGAVITMKQADGVVTQRLVRFGNSLPMSAVRHSVSDSSWSAFTAQKSAISLINGWSDYDGGSQFATAAYHILESGDVCLEGLIKPTGAIDADPILNLPAWVRPSKNRVFELSCDTGRCQVVLGPSGDLIPLIFSGTPNFVSLESVRYSP